MREFRYVLTFISLLTPALLCAEPSPTDAMRLAAANAAVASLPLSGGGLPRLGAAPAKRTLQFQPIPLPLTGSEGVTRESYEEAIRPDGQIGDAFPDLRDTLGELEATAAQLGGSSTLTAVRHLLRWLEMRRDWARAVALGNAEEAADHAQQSQELLAWMREHGSGLEADREGSFYPWWDADIIRVVATTQKTLLTAAADAIRFEAAYLSDGLDPEGFLRQNLGYAAWSAEKTGELMVHVGELSEIAERYRLGF